MFRTRQTAQLLCLTAAALATIRAATVSAAGQAASGGLKAGCSTYASTPLPPDAENHPVPKSFPACASYRSYQGIGRPVNYPEAMDCALQERLAQKAGLPQNPKEPTAWVIGGSLTLADIYFNGAGVKQNVPLAMRFACESEQQMAELAFPDIAKLYQSHRAQGRFEFCDYAATTFTMDFCAEYASEIKDDRRSRYYTSLKSSMTPVQRAAFEKLLKAQKAYVRAHASEVDQGGTIRPLRTLGSEDILNDLFHTELRHFEGKQWPSLSDTQRKTADALLRRQYQKTLMQLRARPKQEMYQGAVTADHVSNVQEAWATYRDTWVAFASLRYPANIEAIRAELTLHRYSLLKTIS